MNGLPGSPCLLRAHPFYGAHRAAWVGREGPKDGRRLTPEPGVSHRAGHYPEGGGSPLPCPVTGT